VGDCLVPLKVCASELGVHRRTLGRQIKNQREAKARVASEWHAARSATVAAE